MNMRSIQRRGAHSCRNMALLSALLSLMLLAGAALAQDAPSVSDDDVNAIAKRMYCPVCENIPLDVCPTEACRQWRADIRAQLEAGRSADEIIASFVSRYGDRVVGVPQDDTLRGLSLVTPWIIALGVLAGAGAALARWRRLRAAPAAASSGASADVSDDDYRARLETDLRARR